MSYDGIAHIWLQALDAPTGQGQGSWVILPQAAQLFGLFKSKERKQAASLRRLTQQSISGMERLCASGEISPDDVAMVKRHILVRKDRLKSLIQLENGQQLSELENAPNTLRWHEAHRDELEVEATVLSQNAEALVKYLRQKQDQ